MNNKDRGSLTVEAALVLPFIIFVVLTFLYLFKVLALQLDLQEAMTETASSVSEYGYIVVKQEEGNSVSEEQEKKLGISQIVEKFAKGQVVSEQVKAYFPELKDYAQILRGNITYSESDILSDDETIDIIANYDIEIPVPLIKIMPFQVKQRVRTRAFVGSNELIGSGGSDGASSNEVDAYVYITQYGTVYHESIDCTYLKLSIHECSFNEVGEKRNTGGAKYYACEKCCKGEATGGVVYITDDGTCYHTDRKCSGLKRIIQRVPLSTVKDRKACSKCCGE